MRVLVDSLLHHFDIDLGHVYLPTELGRELGLLQQLGIHAGRHVRDAGDGTGQRREEGATSDGRVKLSRHQAAKVVGLARRTKIGVAVGPMLLGLGIQASRSIQEDTSSCRVPRY